MHLVDKIENVRGPISAIAVTPCGRHIISAANNGVEVYTRYPTGIIRTGQWPEIGPIRQLVLGLDNTLFTVGELGIRWRQHSSVHGWTHVPTPRCIDPGGVIQQLVVAPDGETATAIVDKNVGGHRAAYTFLINENGPAGETPAEGVFWYPDGSKGIIRSSQIAHVTGKSTVISTGRPTQPCIYRASANGRTLLQFGPDTAIAWNLNRQTAQPITSKPERGSKFIGAAHIAFDRSDNPITIRGHDRYRLLRRHATIGEESDTHIEGLPHNPISPFYPVAIAALCNLLIVGGDNEIRIYDMVPRPKQ